MPKGWQTSEKYNKILEKFRDELAFEFPQLVKVLRSPTKVKAIIFDQAALGNSYQMYGLGL